MYPKCRNCKHSISEDAHSFGVTLCRDCSDTDNVDWCDYDHDPWGEAKKTRKRKLQEIAIADAMAKSEPHVRCGKCGKEVPGGHGTPTLCIDCLPVVGDRAPTGKEKEFEMEWADGWDPQMHVDEEGNFVAGNDKYPFWQKGWQPGSMIPDTVVECVDNSGMEDQFDKGVEYVLDSKKGDFFTVYDKLGVKQECFGDRFKEVVGA
jgi:hypothetical protein